MKTLQFLLLSLLFIVIAHTGFSQSTTKETFKVAGECGMCKKHIEKAAKEAGASYALWNEDSKVLTVKYSSTSTNKAKIQQSIANVGYDTPEYKATTEAYNRLDECCQYQRTSVTTAGASCCDKAKCSNNECAGKCTEDMSCCKNETCAKDNCCKKA